MLGELYRLAVRNVILQRVAEFTKCAALPQFATTPLSSLTARADFIANKKYKPEQNPLTSEEQALLEKLTAGMSKSRSRIVGARRSARKSVQNMLAGTSLWG